MYHHFSRGETEGRVVGSGVGGWMGGCQSINILPKEADFGAGVDFRVCVKKTPNSCRTGLALVIP